MLSVSVLMQIDGAANIRETANTAHRSWVLWKGGSNSDRPVSLRTGARVFSEWVPGCHQNRCPGVFRIGARVFSE
jgi:hypothetical protein